MPVHPITNRAGARAAPPTRPDNGRKMMTDQAKSSPAAPQYPVWVLVVDDKQAKVFRHEGESLVFVRDFFFSKSHEDEIEAPQQRSYVGTDGRRYRTVDGPKSLRRNAAIFAKELCGTLDEFADKDFKNIVFVGRPDMLGWLKSSYSDKLQSCVLREIDCDIDTFGPRSLESKIAFLNQPRS